MVNEMEEICLQKVEEFVQDDDKIVTVPYLSRNLNIPISDSQTILSKYVNDCRKLKPTELSISFILTGFLTNKDRAVKFVKEDDLERERKLFKEIINEMIFSVQKSKEINFNAISLVDAITSDQEPLFGSVVGKNCVKRILKFKKLPTPPPSTIKGKSSFFLKKEPSTGTDKSTDNSTKKAETNSHQNGIASMFSKAVSNTGKETTDKKPAVSNISQKPKGGLSAFLSKGSSSSSIKSEKEIEKIKEEDFHEDIEMTVDNVTEDTSVKQKHVSEKKQSDIKTSEKKQSQSTSKTKTNSNKRHREKNDDKKILKKRKRIIQQNDSDSDDMFASDKEDNIEKSDDEPEAPPSPVAKQPLAPKSKIRKAVEKSYLDDEGFMVTKTEYIYESAPEDDEVTVSEKDETKPKLEKKTSSLSENDVSAPQAAKNKNKKKGNLQNQPTLMNFFKKK